MRKANNDHNTCKFRKTVNESIADYTLRPSAVSQESLGHHIYVTFVGQLWTDKYDVIHKTARTYVITKGLITATDNIHQKFSAFITSLHGLNASN